MESCAGPYGVRWALSGSGELVGGSLVVLAEDTVVALAADTVVSLVADTGKAVDAS